MRGEKDIGADSNRRRQRAIAPFEHGNLFIRKRLESLRRRRSDHGAGGGGLVSADHLSGGFHKKKRFEKFFFWILILSIVLRLNCDFSLAAENRLSNSKRDDSESASNFGQDSVVFFFFVRCFLFKK